MWFRDEWKPFDPLTHPSRATPQSDSGDLLGLVVCRRRKRHRHWDYGAPHEACVPRVLLPPQVFGIQGLQASRRPRIPPRPRPERKVALARGPRLRDGPEACGFWSPAFARGGDGAAQSALPPSLVRFGASCPTSTAGRGHANTFETPTTPPNNVRSRDPGGRLSISPPSPVPSPSVFPRQATSGTTWAQRPSPRRRRAQASC